jgi:tetratricopeptide (TPR) repeat protein
MLKRKSKYLEEKVRFSKSILWDAQTNYYEDTGIEAWKKGVPYYITSNNYVANLYAHGYLAYLADLKQRKILDLKHPVYLFELGAGSGTFGYLLHQQIANLLEDYGLTDVHWLVVLTDVANSNLSYWQTQSQLMALAQKGTLDFAHFDMRSPCKPHLITQNQSIEDWVNPILIVANYVFDSIPCDAFCTDPIGLYEKLITTRAKKRNPRNPTDLETAFIKKRITLPYYNEPMQDRLLQTHLDRHETADLVMPTAAFALFDFFSKLQPRLFCLSADKGSYDLDEAKLYEQSDIVYHGGSCSVNVNFHALHTWFEAHNGEGVHESAHSAIHTACFFTNDHLEDLPMLRSQLKTRFQTLGVGGFYNITQQYNSGKNEMTLQSFSALMRLSHYDAQTFMCYGTRISKLYEASAPHDRAHLLSIFEQVIAHHYDFPGADLFFDLGYLYTQFGLYEKAIPCYHRSHQNHPSHQPTLYNLGLCYYDLNQFDQSQVYFIKALKLDPQCHETKHWLSLAIAHATGVNDVV